MPSVSYCDVISYLWRSIQVVMGGCFFDCFRVRHRHDDTSTNPRPHHPHHTHFLLPTTEDDGSDEKKQALLSAEEQENGGECSSVEEQKKVGPSEIDDQGLVEQAKFLKAWGTLPETPAEIRKAVRFAENLVESDVQIPSTVKLSSGSSIECQEAGYFVEQQSPDVTESSHETPAEIRKAVRFAENLVESDVQTPSMVKLSSGSSTDCQEAGDFVEQQSPVMAESSPETPADFLHKNVVPRIVEASGSDSYSSALESSPETPEEGHGTVATAECLEKSDMHRAGSLLKSSPNPTPRKITDDMQTPGTVFATNMKSLTKGNARIRSQYVYTVLGPIENLCSEEELEKAQPVHEDSIDPEGEHLSEHVNATPYFSMTSKGKSAKKESLGDVSLSTWLKPPRPGDNGDRRNPGAVSSRKLSIGRFTIEEKPIVRWIATDLNKEEETSQVSPKWWGGNGIPNSTTKYKEDQKVCWHATPFEERLEKALSEDTCVPQRKSIAGTPLLFEEEGDDTATSQMQSTNILESVISS